VSRLGVEPRTRRLRGVIEIWAISARICGTALAECGGTRQISATPVQPRTSRGRRFENSTLSAVTFPRGFRPMRVTHPSGSKRHPCHLC
jgi:hypothetical protein